MRTECLLFCFCLVQCASAKHSSVVVRDVILHVSGIAPNAGYPQADCLKECRTRAWADPSTIQHVASICIQALAQNKVYIIDATLDFKDQYRELTQTGLELRGIFLTRAHICHYVGLIHLGREDMATKQVPVYCMDTKSSFITDNGPWAQLVQLENMLLHRRTLDNLCTIGSTVKIHSVIAPDGDEYSETVGYHNVGPYKSALFIPEIEKWNLRNQEIAEWVKRVDYAFLDARFYTNVELPRRDMIMIPHLFTVGTMRKLSSLPRADHLKVHFVDLNHTNPLLDSSSKAYRSMHERGFNLAVQGMTLGL